MNNYSKYSKDAVNVRDFINKINETAKMLKEAYVYEDDIETHDEMGDEVVSQEVENPVNDGKEFVDAIRKSALQGIQAFADDVDSPSYEFFKKVFILADKVLSEKENDESED